MKRILGPLAGLVVFFVALVLSLVLADLVARVALNVPARYLKKIVHFDHSLSPAKRLRPNLNEECVGAFREFIFRVTTDANGFRKNKPTSTASNLTPEIVVLGDSQTFGQGVNDEETFSSLLSEDLRLSILNTGCPGYNNYEALELARSIISYLKPKILILSFFSGNDPYENSRAIVERTVPFKETKQRPRFSLGEAKAWLVRNSSLYILMTQLRKYEAINKVFYQFGLINEAPPQELEVFKKNASGSGSDFWKATDSAVLQLSEMCQAHQVEFVVLFVPDRYQVDSNYWDQWVQKYRLPKSEFDLDAPNQHMRRLCEMNGIRFIDATTSLRQHHVAGGQMYWRIDNHLAPEGHRVISKVLGDYLKKSEALAS